MHYIVISPCILQTVEITTSHFNSKWQLRPMKTITKKWPKMAICELPNGQNDPRNINWKYTDQEYAKIA